MQRVLFPKWCDACEANGVKHIVAVVDSMGLVVREISQPHRGVHWVDEDEGSSYLDHDLGMLVLDRIGNTEVYEAELITGTNEYPYHTIVGEFMGLENAKRTALGIIEEWAREDARF